MPAALLSGCESSLRCVVISAVGSIRHNIDDSALDDDHFAHRLAFQLLRDFFIAQCRLFDCFLIGISGHGYLAAHLAVDLNGQLDLIVHEHRGVIAWPGLQRDQFGMPQP